MRPTEEQQSAIEMFRTGNNLRIIAYAGAGKTSTLRLIASDNTRKGRYLAFNRDIAQEARTKFPSRCKCSTTHSLAFQSMVSEYSEEKLRTNLNGKVVRDRLALGDFSIDQEITLKSETYSRILISTVRRFCLDSSQAIMASHFKPEGLLTNLDAKILSSFVSKVLSDANALWQRMKDPSDSLPLGFDGYLKAWALSRPLINADYILLDEAQDTNQVVLDLMLNQQCQLVLVGDPFQQIYDWRGAVNAMDRFNPESTSYLTQSFRFGETIADAANQIISTIGATVPIRGNPNVSSSISQVYADAVLCRTNVGLMANLFTAQAAGIKPYIAGGTSELTKLLSAVQFLQDGKPAHIPEFYGYQNWRQVVADVEDHGLNSDLRTLVKLVQTFDAGTLLRAIDSCETNPELSRLTLSTGHRSKGLEWDFVTIEDDFATPFERVLSIQRDPSTPNNTAASVVLSPSEITALHLKINESPSLQAEIRLLYVALTRCKEAVQIPRLIRVIFDLALTVSGKQGTRKSSADAAEHLKKAYRSTRDVLREDL